jgi:putative colanic acid biosysnthesis UDP-glucose lipid carrier transferase
VCCTGIGKHTGENAMSKILIPHQTSERVDMTTSYSNTLLKDYDVSPVYPSAVEIEVKPQHIAEGSAWGKRIVDIVGGLVGMVLLALIVPYVKLKMRKESPGPVFFRQPRTGKNGKIFLCYKFRSMHINDDSNRNGKPVITTVGDTRIFPFGQFLRKTNLDEFPQLINVLKGEMSLVGPRPYPVAECEHWGETIPNWNMRYAVRPGITGWAQVTGFRGGTYDVEHMTQRLRRDFVYLENLSVRLDYLILVKTLKSTISGNTGAH